MVELADSRHRVSFRLRDGLDRDTALDGVAGLLLREKPEHTAIVSLTLYPPEEGAHAEDPRIETFMWELQFSIDEESGRDWEWGDVVNEELAERIRERFAHVEPNTT